MSEGPYRRGNALFLAVSLLLTAGVLGTCAFVAIMGGAPAAISFALGLPPAGAFVVGVLAYVWSRLGHPPSGGAGAGDA